jgi:hypothetical protein
MVNKTGKKTIVDFNRHQIGCIDLLDLKNVEEMTESQRKSYIQDAEAVWNNPVFQNEILIMIQKQLEYMGMEASSIDEILVSRGTINGIDLFRMRFETYHNQHLEAIKPAEDFDEFEVIPG